MGCENSQIADAPPHEVQNLPPDNSPDLHKPSQQVCKPTPSNQKKLYDKENHQPHELPPSKRDAKERNNSRKGSELKKKSIKSECHLEEKPVIVETTNIPKQNIVLEENKTVSGKRASQLSARAIEQPEEAPIGPSSKSIQAPTDPLRNTGVESFPISNVLEEGKEQPEEEKPEEKVQQVAQIQEKKSEKEELQAERVGTSESQRLQLTPFNLDQFQKTKRGKEVESQEVENYLNVLWSYEAQVVNGIIDRLEERERKRYEEVAC